MKFHQSFSHASALAIVAHIERYLKPVFGDQEALQAAWWLLEAVTEAPQEMLLSQEIVTLSEDQERLLHRWLDELVEQKKPLAYVLGSVPFAGTTILVRPPILIPRQETEEWVLYLVDQLRSLGQKKLKILDLCTGSGAIGVALAKAFPNAHIIASDCADYVLTLAEENVSYNQVTNMHVVHSDIFSGLDSYKPFDLIVANPPYIDPAVWDTLDESVRRWEDPQALLADHQGLAILEKIIQQAPYYLSDNKQLKKKGIPELMVEIGYDQGPAVQRMLQQAHYINIKIWRDLSGKDRVVMANISKEDVGESKQ
jgi:release factor glutamine methyltransferase